MGSGLFIATGKALAEGGPGNMFLGYLVVCIGVWANLQNLTEMTIAFPTSGNYIDYADRWVDPALAFGAGVAEWLGWTSVFASEATFFVILVNYWAEGAVPDAALRKYLFYITVSPHYYANVFQQSVFSWSYVSPYSSCPIDFLDSSNTLARLSKSFYSSSLLLSHSQSSEELGQRATCVTEAPGPIYHSKMALG